MTRAKQMDSDDLAGAAAQLKRVLFALAKLDDDKAHSLADVAEAAGTDQATLLRDLRTLVERDGDEPAGFIDSVSLAVDATTVRLEAPGFFRRPMGLTRTELCALELGLATLRQELPPEEHRSIESARARLGQAITGLAGDASMGGAHAAHLGEDTAERRAMRKCLQQCITAHCVAELAYQSAEATSPSWRRVRPIGFVFARGSWYLVAFASTEGDVRVFRFDRISAAKRTEEAFEAPASFQLGSVVHEGRVLTGLDEKVRIRFSARIARWIAEREGVGLDADGSVTVEYGLGDMEWVVRFVLQYGGEAEIVSPAEVRERVRGRVEGMMVR